MLHGAKIALSALPYYCARGGLWPLSWEALNLIRQLSKLDVGRKSIPRSDIQNRWSLLSAEPVQEFLNKPRMDTGFSGTFFKCVGDLRHPFRCYLRWKFLLILSDPAR